MPQITTDHTETTTDHMKDCRSLTENRTSPGDVWSSVGDLQCFSVSCFFLGDLQSSVSVLQ